MASVWKWGQNFRFFSCFRKSAILRLCWGRHWPQWPHMKEDIHINNIHYGYSKYCKAIDEKFEKWQSFNLSAARCMNISPHFSRFLGFFSTRNWWFFSFLDEKFKIREMCISSQLSKFARKLQFHQFWKGLFRFESLYGMSAIHWKFLLTLTHEM